MRTSPMPQPPEGLKDRLIQQALEAEAAGPAWPARSRFKLAWAAIPALVLVAGWIAWHGSMPIVKQGVPNRTPPGPRDVATAPVVKTPPKAPVPQPDRQAAIYKPRHHNASKKPFLPVPMRTVEPPVQGEPRIRVSVSHTRQQEEGYARVACYSTDDGGHTVRTEWTLVNNPKAGATREEMSVNDDSGQRQSLKVAIVMPPSKPKGEEL